MWKDWKDVRPVCVMLTMLLGRRLDLWGPQARFERVYGDDCGSRSSAWRDGKSGYRVFPV